LRWHNLATAYRHVTPGDGDPVDLLMRAAEELRADLLVMGGYSHSRLREAVFGGFTRRILRGANLPVLMVH
jgi:nucleotide-binding universal stress UspA family protein